jgi:hypothetical protein
MTSIISLRPSKFLGLQPAVFTHSSGSNFCSGKPHAAAAAVTYEHRLDTATFAQTAGVSSGKKS